MKKKFMALLLMLSMIFAFVPFMTAYAVDGDENGDMAAKPAAAANQTNVDSETAPAIIDNQSDTILKSTPATAENQPNATVYPAPTTDADALLRDAGLTISGNTDNSWNYGLTLSNENVLRITGENVVISGTAKVDMMIAINPNISKVTIKNLNHGGRNLTFMNNDENWEGTRSINDTTGKTHTIELLGSNSLGAIEFYDFTRPEFDLGCNISGDQSISFTGNGTLECNYIFNHYRLTFGLKSGGKIDATNTDNPEESISEGYAVYSAGSGQGIFLKANNVITTPKDGQIYDSKYVANANNKGADHAVIEFQETDQSSQTGDKGISTAALLLALVSLGAAGITIGLKRSKA